jgi:hypothetical protein
MSRDEKKAPAFIIWHTRYKKSVKIGTLFIS